jgi:hypothetical protein
MAKDLDNSTRENAQGPKRAADMRNARVIPARYDAASTSPDNYRHRANADGLSASPANSPNLATPVKRDLKLVEAGHPPRRHGRQRPGPRETRGVERRRSAPAALSVQFRVLPDLSSR